MKIAVFPGSFDPITVGHLDIIKRALPLFDRFIIAIGINPKKNYLFTLEQRMAWINSIFADEDKVFVDSYEGLTVHFCQKVNAKYLVRGLRNTDDFEFEKSIAQMNHSIGKGIETLFLMTNPKYTPVSSSIIREIIRGGGEVSAFLPKEIQFK